ncbi:MAG TPA: 50S ribosomal protein L21 [Candidatus Dormibacteraeota bacterium]|nr:50S ribosomal protein L21 [Candidatus Dormibacteraeota bacterium]
MPKPERSLSAVVVSGGKQYRVAPGDRILVDRMGDVEPGSSIKLGRVLLFADGSEVKVGAALEGLEVDARVIDHRRGPRIESIRYKSKKRVRVHHGGRAHLTALDIIAVGGVGLETAEEKEAEEDKPKGTAAKKARAKATEKAATRGRAAGRAQGAAGKSAPKAEAVVETKVEEAPKKTTRRRTKKETE